MNSTRIPGSYRVATNASLSQGKSNLPGRNRAFLNFTDKDHTTATKLHEELRTYVELGEQYRTKRLERGQRAEDLRNGKIWNDKDLAFFDSLDVTPYEINIHRPLFNTIVEAQREQKIRFRVAPKDVHAHHRYEGGKQEFVNSMAHDFNSPEEAAEYFDENLDDEFGIMLSALMMDSRETSNGDDAENEVFDDGAIGGMGVLKGEYSTKYDREIGINISSVPQNAVIYDEARSKNYECDDITFIGEIHDYYPEDLIEEYPGKADDIEATYRHLIENRRTFQGNGKSNKQWKDWYQFSRGAGLNEELRIKVADLWTRHTEPKIRAIDKETNKIKVAKHGVEIEQVIDRLLKLMTEELFKDVRSDPNFQPEDLEMFSDPNLKPGLLDMIDQRYEFEEIYEPVWYKSVFTFNGLFEHSRSPYPHNGHPYTFYFSQYHHGYFRGMAEDVVDAILGFNKAIGFQELMMAHGAKNVLLVDEDTLIDNDINKEDIADEWTRIGSVIALKLKPGYRLPDVVQSVNTVGQGIQALDRVIERYQRLINEVLGVIPEQLGASSADAPTSRYSMQVQQGIGNNGLIFKNFYRSLKNFYKKILTMEVELLKVRKNRVVKLLGEEYKHYYQSNFLNVEWSEDFQMFEETLHTGQYGLTVVPVEDNPQLGAAREGMLMEMGGQGAIPIELAFKYSNWDKRHKFVKDLRNAKREQFVEQLQNQVDVNQLAEIMASEGYSGDTADRILKKVRLENAKKLNQSQQQENTSKGNNGRIANLANQMGNAGQQQQIQNAQATGQPDNRQN